MHWADTIYVKSYAYGIVDGYIYAHIETMRLLEYQFHIRLLGRPLFSIINLNAKIVTPNF